MVYGLGGPHESKLEVRFCRLADFQLHSQWPEVIRRILHENCVVVLVFLMTPKWESD